VELTREGQRIPGDRFLEPFCKTGIRIDAVCKARQILTGMEKAMVRTPYIVAFAVSTLTLVALGGTAVNEPHTANTTAAPRDAKSFCSKLQPLVQPLVKLPLVLSRADDSKSDSLHAGETQYVDCDFRQKNTQLDVSLHDDSDKMFDNTAQRGYAALPGFGDKARYSVRGAMGMRWVDVVRGTTACEARFTLEDGQLKGDWKQAGGKMCDAALKAR
jgi:hypothetical protein